MIIILQWIVWGFAVFFFLGFLVMMRQEAKEEGLIHIITVLQTVLFLLLPVLFLFLAYNKFHLIWIMPSAFILSYSAFVILRIPVIGTVLRIIIVFFSIIFFVGLDGPITIRGVPFGK